MSGFFYAIVNDAITYDNKEEKAELYDLTLLNMKSWCVAQMESIGVPDQFIEFTMQGLDSDFTYKLWRYIQDTCEPDPDEDEEEAE